MNIIIPKWITVISILIALLGVFVGASLYFSPATFIPNVDFSSTGVRYLASMWAARQITLGSILGFSVLRRSIPMLQLSLAAYSLMNIQDAVIGILQNDIGLIIGAFIFAVLPATMVFRLTKLNA